MRSQFLFAIVILMSTLAVPQTLPTPQAITDPKQITSKPDGQVVNVTNTREVAELRPTWSPNGRYVAYMVKPKTSSVYEIDVFDTLMRQTKHVTTGTPKEKMNVGPIWSKDGKFIVYTQEQAK